MCESKQRADLDWTMSQQLTVDTALYQTSNIRYAYAARRPSGGTDAAVCLELGSTASL